MLSRRIFSNFYAYTNLKIPVTRKTNRIIALPSTDIDCRKSILILKIKTKKSIVHFSHKEPPLHICIRLHPSAYKSLHRLVYTRMTLMKVFTSVLT